MERAVYLLGPTLIKLRIKTLRNRQTKQGIQNNKQNKLAARRWKYKEPLELETESKTDIGAGFSPPLFSFSLKESHPKLRRLKSNKEKRQITEWRTVREHKREASRPYYQFIYQISKERQRIQDKSTSREGTSIGIPDINTTAYENIKNTWTKRGIQNRRQGILPRMSWKHEEPLNKGNVGGPAPVLANSLGKGSYKVGEAPARRIFRSSSPVKPNHYQASSVMNTS